MTDVSTSLFSGIRDGRSVLLSETVLAFSMSGPFPLPAARFPTVKTYECCVLRDMHVSCNELRPPAFATVRIRIRIVRMFTRYIIHVLGSNEIWIETPKRQLKRRREDVRVHQRRSRACVRPACPGRVRVHSREARRVDPKHDPQAAARVSRESQAESHGGVLHSRRHAPTRAREAERGIRDVTEWLPRAAAVVGIHAVTRLKFTPLRD